MGDKGKKIKHNRTSGFLAFNQNGDGNMGKYELNNMTSDMEHLLNAIRVSMQHGGSFLTNRRAPNGPIMREPNLSYIHKATWGMYAA